MFGLLVCCIFGLTTFLLNTVLVRLGSKRIVIFLKDWKYAFYINLVLNIFFCSGCFLDICKGHVPLEDQGQAGQTTHHGWPKNTLEPPPEDLEEVAEEKEVWASLFRLLPHGLVPWVQENGWRMDSALYGTILWHSTPCSNLKIILNKVNTQFPWQLLCHGYTVAWILDQCGPVSSYL